MHYGTASSQRSATTEVIPECADYQDNDGDGLIDMDDLDCQTQGDFSEAAICMAGLPIAEPPFDALPALAAPAQVALLAAVLSAALYGLRRRGQRR